MQNLKALAAIGAVALILSSEAHAQEYPERPVTIVVPYSAGGSTDILGRLIADKLQEKLGASVVVENRGGAGSALGTQFVAQAPADGYTLLMASSAHTVNPAIRDDVAYDPVENFAPISRLVTIPHVLVVSNEFAPTTLSELIDYAKENPGEINYGSSGPGTSNHLESELLAREAGIELTHVPYQGIAPAITDLLAGRLQMIMGSLPSMRSNIDADTVRPLAVTSLQRAPTDPDLPTIDEAGISGFETVDWLGLLAPAGTDVDIVGKLAQAIDEIYGEEAFLDRLRQLGFVPEGSSPDAFADVLANDVWSRTARDLGIKAGN